VAAAVTLARHGFRVAIVERNRWLGGLAGGVPGGFPETLFAYAIGLVPRELDEWLSLLPRGSVYVSEPSWVELSDGEILLRWWVSRERRDREFREAGLDGLPELLNLSDRFWRCFKALGLYYTPEPPTPADAASEVDRCDSEAAVFLERSVKSILGSYLPREWWDTIIYPSMYPANGFTLAYYLQGSGVWGQVLGGMSRLSLHLENLARSHGVDLILGSEAVDIEVRGGRARGVVIRGGGVVRARRAVVLAAPLNVLLSMDSAAGKLPESDVRRLRLAFSRRSQVVRVDYLVRSKPSPPAEKGWRGTPIYVSWGEKGGGDYTYPTLINPGEPHLIRLSGSLRDPLDEVPPGVDERDVVLWWVRGRREQEACCLNETGHPDHIPMVDPHIMDGRPIPGWGGYRTPIEGLYHGSASSYPGGEINGVAGFNAALRIIYDSGVKPRLPPTLMPSRRQP